MGRISTFSFAGEEEKADKRSMETEKEMEK